MLPKEAALCLIRKCLSLLCETCINREKIEKEKENHRLQSDLNESRRQINVLSTEKNTLVDQCKQIQVLEVLCLKMGPYSQY